jgi:signal transduction histidine kinase
MDSQISPETSLNPLYILQRAFPGIPAFEAADLVAASRSCTFLPGTVICHEGALEDTFYILLQGDVQISKWINDREERVLKQLHPGDFFGEMAIVHNAPRAATVIAISECATIELRKVDFSRLLERSNSMSLAILREVSRRLRENDEMAIEDLRLKADQLAEAYQHLAELERARREFLTSIAHELRTPLMAASGFLQVIQAGMLQGEALKSALQTVDRSVQEITSLTNDLLFVQEMDLILPEFKPTDLGALVAAAVKQQRSHAEHGKVSLTLNISSGIPALQADPSSLGRAISAILDNAIKFSPDGGNVTVDVGFDDQHEWVRIQDHGLGISAEALPKIFNRFYHQDQIGSHLFRGLGLGLSIARQVVEQHHGQIEVQSIPASGSAFTIWLNHKQEQTLIPPPG